MDMGWISYIEPYAIFLGVLTALGLSLAAGIVIAIAMGLDMTRQWSRMIRDIEDERELEKLEERFDEQVDEHFEHDLASPAMLWALLVISLLVNVLAGYVAAWQTRSAEPMGAWVNAGVVGLVGSLLSALLDRDPPIMPALLRWLYYLLAIPTALAGAWLALR